MKSAAPQTTTSIIIVSDQTHNLLPSIDFSSLGFSQQNSGDEC